MLKYPLALVGIVSLLLTFSGCGGVDAPYGLVPIEGVVTHKGTPVSGGFIVIFQPLDNSRASEGIVKDGGKFKLIHTPQLAGAKVGHNTVYIRSIEERVPEGYKELVEKYGLNTAGIPIDVSKKNTSMILDFP